MEIQGRSIPENSILFYEPAKSGESGHPIPEQTGQVCRMKVVT
jgi:hypothetical protein